jgi:DNA-binding MarR family transcriptional regulator
MAERPISRRHTRLPYMREMLPRDIEASEKPPSPVDALTAAGRMGSALRKTLRAHDIDPKLARLVLLLYGRRDVRVREIAWHANVHPSTASRWLDRAERLGIVDKFYDDVLDRRATSARLTKRGREMRRRVEELLEQAAPYRLSIGRAYGRRAMSPQDRVLDD